MMRRILNGMHDPAGLKRPSAGGENPARVSLGVLLGLLLIVVGCGSTDNDRNLDPAQVGLTKDVAPIFDDGETKLFEVKRGLQFPILRPSDAQAAALQQQVIEPYGRMPWITNHDVELQLTWTLSNLDEEDHVVELLIDPWNEFGRYYPGMSLTDAEEQKFEPNSSGIDHYYTVSGKASGDASRRHGTLTFADMNELAIDFATVEAMIKTPPPLPGGVDSDPTMMTDPLPIYANHAFNFLNQSYDDALIAPYIPKLVAGLTGIDFGFRTAEKATVALDIQVEIVDNRGNRVQADGGNSALLAPTTQVVTVGSTVPAAM